MIRRQEVIQLLSLYEDLLDRVESLRNNLYSANVTFDEDNAYETTGDLQELIIDLGDMAKEMDDRLLAEEMRSDGKEE